MGYFNFFFEMFNLFKRSSSTKNEPQISRKLKENLDNLNEGIINPSEFKTMLAQEIEELQNDGMEFQEICNNLKYLKKKDVINQNEYKELSKKAYQRNKTVTPKATSTTTSTTTSPGLILSMDADELDNFDSSDSESDEEEKKFYQWEFKNEYNKWIKYGFSINEKANNAYSIGESGFDYMFERNLYRVDFDKTSAGRHIQKNVITYTQRSVRRVHVQLSENDDSVKIKKFQWKWKDEHNKWNDYPTDINNKIKKAQKSGVSVVSFDVNGNSYQLIFANLHQKNTSTNMIRPVKRVTKE